MRILILGTGPFAVPMFQSLLDSAHEIPALITRPTPPPRGREKASLNPMRDLALARGLPVHAPESIHSPDAAALIASLAPDLFMVCDYGQILSREVLALAPLGGINLHASLLPKYRGAAPINWAIYHGEVETGVSVIHMTPRLDGGPCLTVLRTPIAPDETAPHLEHRLAQLGIQAVFKAIELLSHWDRQSAIGAIQDQALATKAPRLKKTDGAVNWSRSAAQIRNQVRAFQPWPGTYTHWLRCGGEPLRLILDQVSLAPDSIAGRLPGEVVVGEGQRLIIATGGGALSLDVVQPAGKRVMPISEFLPGYPLRLGACFGEPA